MVEKVKRFLKKNILGIIIGGLIFGTAGVYAATYFPSGDVTYDNSTSGLSSTDVQGAIDELYGVCTHDETGPSAGDQLLDEVNIVTSGDGLYKDEYEDRYFYKGANPNNYINFNNSLWRIISIENDGTIKIMKNENIGEMAWDTSVGVYWGTASLNVYLNNSFLATLSDTSKIVSKNFSIGEVTLLNSSLKSQVDEENATLFNAKVGIITVSEFLRSNSNISQCSTFLLNSDNRKICVNTSWITNTLSFDNFWTITPAKNSYNDPYVYPIGSNGYIDYISNSNFKNNVFPVIYLSSTVKITGGDGSQNNPFVIE